MNDFLTVAQGIADEAREIALTYFGMETDSTWKEDGTPLTVADTKINTLVIERIRAAFPTHSVQRNRCQEPFMRFVTPCAVQVKREDIRKVSDTSPHRYDH